MTKWRIFICGGLKNLFYQCTLPYGLMNGAFPRRVRLRGFVRRSTGGDMERKTFSKVQIYVRNSFNQAGKMAANGNYNEAISILVPVVKANPGLPVLFEKLREYEIEKCRRQNPFSKIFAILISIIPAIFIRIYAFIDPVRAMAMCESHLARCVDNPLMISAVAAAANICEAPWVAATALNVIRVFHPNNESNLRRLGYAMQRNEQAGEALKIFQTLARNAPGNLAVQNELRSAMALASIERGRWEEEGETQKKAADAKDAVLQQLLDGTIHDVEQAQLLIEKFTEDLKTNDSIDMRRKLADAYMVAGDFESAQREYEKVAEKLGVADPVLDKQIEKAYISQLEKSIEELRAHPDQYEDAEGQAAELSRERDAYILRHTVSRAKQFPNDVQLQFDLGVLRFNREEIEEAKQIFEQVVQSPQKRRACLVYLGRIALMHNDFQEAISKFEEALTEMYRMDKAKREALYYLGLACEEAGETKKALEAYCQIHANMQSYRDVAARITRLSAADNEA